MSYWIKVNFGDDSGYHERGILYHGFLGPSKVLEMRHEEDGHSIIKIDPARLSSFIEMQEEGGDLESLSIENISDVA
jgi:hypothetical protein